MTALDELCAMRWPDGVQCPRCGSGNPYRHRNRPIFGCSSPPCRKQFSVTTGTAYGYRKLPPERLLQAFRVFPRCRGPADLMRALNVEYRSAHTLWMRLKGTGGRLT